MFGNFFFGGLIFHSIRLLNKRESEDQAHFYVPQERKPKNEESPEQSKKNINKILPDNSVIIKRVNEVPKNDELMNTNSNMDDMTVKIESMDTIESPKNYCDINTTTNKKTPTDEDLNNFKNSISYVSTILVIWSLIIKY